MDLYASRMVMWGVLNTASLIVVASGTAQAQCCDGSVGSGGQVNSPACSGANPYESKEFEYSHSVTGINHCLSGGWTSDPTNVDPFAFSVSGECGITPQLGQSDPPQCAPIVHTPQSLGCDGTDEVVVRTVVQDAHYDGGSGCSHDNGEYMTLGSPYTSGTCTSSFCCSQQSACNMVGEWSATTCTCTISPLLIDTRDANFSLSAPESGPLFDMIPGGERERRSWPTRGVGFLVLDRNGDGLITDGSELFGSVTEQPPSEHRNGFAALARYDLNKDQRIDSSDRIFGDLRLWLDDNSDGLSQTAELLPLAEFGIQGIALNYKETDRRDRFGNIFRYRARLFIGKRARVSPIVWDVFLVGVPCFSGLSTAPSPTQP